VKNAVILFIFSSFFLFVGIFAGKQNKNIERKQNEKHNINTNVRLGWQEIPPTIKCFNILVDIDKDLTNILDTDLITKKIELESMRLGINVSTNYCDTILKYNLFAKQIGSSELYAYGSDLFIMKNVEFKIDSTNYEVFSSIWETGLTGYFNIGDAKNYIQNQIQSQLDTMSRDFLRTKSKSD
jgi:hypothetical protein